MTTKERYQQCLDQAYQFAPFRLLEVIDLKHPDIPGLKRICQVCGNKRIRYLCKCTTKAGAIWYIGRDCHTELYNRQFEDNLHGHS